MKNKQYLEKREQWRAMIRQRDDRSEIVNYDDPSFPSYSFGVCPVYFLKRLLQLDLLMLPALAISSNESLSA